MHVVSKSFGFRLLPLGALGLLVHCVGDDPTAVVAGSDAGPPVADAASAIDASPAIDAAAIEDASTPPLGAFGRIQQIVAGEAFTCALGTSGQVRCWGSNSLGQLGQERPESSRNDVSVTATVPFDTGTRVVELAAAYETVCARFEDLTVRCWGAGAEGERGSGDKTSRGRAPGDLAQTAVDLGGRGASRIYAGTRHFCVIVHNEGDVLCWGLGKDNGGRFGWLGRGDDSTIGDDNGEMGAALSRVPLREKTTDLALGFTSTCALGANGTVRCFGTARGGQLGNSSADATADVHDVDTAPETATGVSALFGKGPAYAASKTDATTVTWGDASNGRLGLGNTTSQFAPVLLPTKATAVRTIVSASSHRCVLLVDGALSCVGDGAFGKLGYGDTAPRGESEATSVNVLAPTRTAVAQVAVGGDHTCAVLTPDEAASDRVVCWGLNTNGQLGPVVGIELGGTPVTAAATLPAFRIE